MIKDSYFSFDTSYSFYSKLRNNSISSFHKLSSGVSSMIGILSKRESFIIILKKSIPMRPLPMLSCLST